MTAREQRFLDLYDQVALAKDQVDRCKRELRQATRTLDEAKAAALQQDRAVARATTAVANASVAHASAIEAHDRALRSIDRVYHKLPGDLHARAQQRQSIERSASSEEPGQRCFGRRKRFWLVRATRAGWSMDVRYCGAVGLHERRKGAEEVERVCCPAAARYEDIGGEKDEGLPVRATLQGRVLCTQSARWASMATGNGVDVEALRRIAALCSTQVIGGPSASSSTNNKSKHGDGRARNNLKDYINLKEDLRVT
ncbi:hypothetical protein IWX92DRAFT_389366 [Phyllosticta citricarpa]